MLFINCYGLNCVPPQNSHVDIVLPNIPKCDYIWSRAFKEVIKVKGPMSRPYSNQTCVLRRRGNLETHKKYQGCIDREKRWPCEDTARRLPSEGKGKRLQKKPNLPTPWLWTFSPQSYEKINFCCLSHAVCGIVLRKC